MTPNASASLLDECPLVVEETDRETARVALYALMPTGQKLTPFAVDALTILLGRVREHERDLVAAAQAPAGPSSCATDEAAFREGYQAGYEQGADLDLAFDIEPALEAWRASKGGAP